MSSIDNFPGVENHKMAHNKIVLLSCGSFNPPTNMHLRMFEIARDHLHRIGTHLVIGGLISPVHDAYGKADLESATHRKEMVQLSLQNSDWIKVSDWECNQESWSRTRQVLNYHQNHVNEILQHSVNDKNSNIGEVSDWFPDNMNGRYTDYVSVKLLCGADLLESFGTPGLWADEDIEAIVGKFGLVVITRSKTNPLEFIYNSDILTKYMSNITIVTEWIENEVSSTKIRRAIRRNESVKYLIPDPVIDYIKEKGLFGYNKQDKYIFINPQNVIMTSPSLSDCMNLCNNNLFDKYSNRTDTVDVFKEKRTKIALVSGKHHRPGQAVKVEKKLDKTKETRVGSSKVPLKSSKSSSDFYSHKLATHKSDDSLQDCKSCDENLIKMIFSKHGIEIISDVETIV